MNLHSLSAIMTLISEPVLLEWGKKPRGGDKHVPLLFLNPETGEAVNYGKPRSEADFEGSEIITWLRHTNNLLVSTAREYDIKLGPEYGQFLEVGLRWAQQLDGRFREKTREQFTAIHQRLETALMNGVPAARKQRRDAGLESLLEATDGMPSDDIARLSGYIAELKHKPVATHEGRREGFSDDSIAKRLSGIRSDQTLDDQFVQSAKLVPPELRTDYVHTVEVAELHGNLPYSLHDSAEEVRKWVNDELGIEQGRLYLRVLHGGMVHFGEMYKKAQDEAIALRKQIELVARERPIGWSDALRKLREEEQRARAVNHPWEFYDSLDKSLGLLDPESRGLELSVLSATQEAGLWFYPYDVMDIMDKVGKRAGQAAIKSVLESAVEALKNGHEAFFGVVEEHGVPAYVREQIMREPQLPK